MQYLTDTDLAYLSEQSEDKMNMIIYGMTSMMDDTNNRVQQLENQTWYQRMANTLTGKNKMTVNEIANNRDKINVYLSEAISCLYDQNKVNQEIILGLGNKLNELYAQQIEIKQIIGMFVDKLNKKIVSIDNFHMLTEEINQGVYNTDNHIVSICLIASKLDARTVHDSRKMDILKRAMYQSGILVDEEEKFIDFLTDLLNVSESDSGIIAMMLDTAKEDYATEIALNTICEYYFMPEKVRKMKSKKSVVEAILANNQIDLDFKISTGEYYTNLMDALANNVVLVEAQSAEREYKEKYDRFKEHFEKIDAFLNFAPKIFASWKVDEAELHAPQKRDKYFSALKKAKMFCSGANLSGTQFITSLNNIDLFIQTIIRIIPKDEIIEAKNEMLRQWKQELKDQGYAEEAISILIGMSNAAFNLCEADGIIEIDGKYYTISKYVQEKIIAPSLDTLQNIEKLGTNSNSNADIASISSLVFDGFSNIIWSSYQIYFAILKECTVNFFNKCPINESVTLLNISEQYPIVFILDENADIIRTNTENEEPFISFSYLDGCGNEQIEKGTMNPTFGLSQKTVVKVQFHNMASLGTIHYEILENSAINDDFEKLEKFKVKWGEWCEHHVCELILTKKTKYGGSFKLKVWADGEPDCIGIIDINYED